MTLCRNRFGEVMSLAPSFRMNKWPIQDFNPVGILTVDHNSNWQPLSGFEAKKSGGVLKAPSGGWEEQCQLN